MCVVIKRAPPDATRILRIGSQLIMDSRVSQGMLSLPFIIIGCLGWKGMSDKLGIEIARMIGFFEWKPEIVHGEHIFEELRLLEVPYPTGLTSWIKQMSQGIRAGVETVIVLRFVDPNTPENNRGMIPVPADHAANVIDGNLLPGLRADMLPPWNFLQYQ